MGILALNRRRFVEKLNDGHPEFCPSPWVTRDRLNDEAWKS